MDARERTNGRSRRMVPAVLMSVSLFALSDVGAQTGGLSVTDVTLVTGNQDMVHAAAFIANLDAGDLVAGRTRWDHDGDGIVYAETRVGFLWSPVDGARPFQIPDSEYYNPQFHAPADISPNGTVVGWRWFTETLRLRPIIDTASHGFEDLPIPPPDNPNAAGQALAISADGSVVAGHVQPDGPFSDAPTKATMWILTDNGPQLLIDASFLEGIDVWSTAWDVNSDGTVIVGDSGPTSAERAATRWIDDTPQTLEPVGSASTARFTSEDGTSAIGLASVGEQDVLVHWDVAGLASIATPPTGATVKSVEAVSSDGTAAAGVLATDDPDSPFGEDWTPFVWTQQHGLVIIPEVGQPDDYDLSEALDISDDGNMVVGIFQASIVFEGQPPALGFIWIRGTGIVLLNDLMTAAGYESPDYWRVDAISGDGRRLLAAGNPPGQALHDTNSIIVELAGVGPPCPGDFNGNEVVDAADLAVLLGAWGPNPGHPADLDGDELVDAADLALFLGTWGPCP